MVGNIKTLHTHVNVDNINNRWVLISFNYECFH